MTPGSFPSEPTANPSPDPALLDAAVADVAAHAASWAATGPASRAGLLDRVLQDTRAAAEGWLAEACRAKGLDPGSSEAGEELLAGIVTVVRMARLLRDSLRQIARTGRPGHPGPVTVAADGRRAGGRVPRLALRPGPLPQGVG